MNEKNLIKIQNLINIKFVETLVPIVKNSLLQEEQVEYSSFSLDVDLFSENWLKWLNDNGITYESPEQIQDYVELKRIGFFSLVEKSLYVPKQFVEKVIILGFLP